MENVTQTTSSRGLTAGSRYMGEVTSPLHGQIHGSAPTLKLIRPTEFTSYRITEFTGTERLGEDFKFTVNLLSDETALKAEQLLNKSITLKLFYSQEKPHIFNGIISGFDLGNIDYQGSRAYSLQIEPWFTRLNIYQDCRIFQNQTVPQIFSAICQEHGFHDYDSSKLKLKYQPLVYCIQYHETSYEFLRRILAEAGIYYIYIHTENQHTLTLLDSQSVINQYADSVEYSNVNHVEEYIPDCISASDYNFAEAGLDLLLDCKLDSRLRGNDGNGRGNDSFCGLEKFFYPGGYKHREHGERVIQNNAQAESWQGKVINGTSNICNLQPGMKFDLNHTDNSRENGAYRVIEIQHFSNRSQYENKIKCVPLAVVYAPIKKPKPAIHPQIARVTGAASQKIYTDEYGQVKVQFYWDKYGKEDENSSCWIRVAQFCSGPNWGSQFIPRPGEEVLVNFINGDLDQPIITGSIYNNLPVTDNYAVSGIKTRASCLLFDDTPNAEKFMLSSEGWLNINILHDASHTIAENENITISGNNTLQIKQGTADIQAQTLTLKVGGSKITLGQAGINITPAGNLHLLASGVGASKPIARVGDNHKCPKYTATTPHIGGPILNGSPVSTANGVAIARVGDKMQCRVGTDIIKQGVDAILADNKPIAKLNSPAAHGGTIVAGSPNIFVGESRGVTVQMPVSTHKQKQQQKIVDLLYATETKTFYALTETEFHQLQREIKPLNNAIANLIDANDKADKEAIKQARQKLNQKLKPLVTASTTTLKELVSFGQKTWLYLTREQIKSSWRKYILPENSEFNYEKIKGQLGSVNVNWEREYNTSITEWAQKFAATSSRGLTAGSGLDVTSAAQIMRFMSGASCGIAFEPKLGRLSFNAGANAKASLFNGEVTSTCYIPDKQGWNITSPVNLGKFLIEFTFQLTGFIGASVLANAQLNCNMTKNGLLKIKGDHDVADGGVNAFAGVKTGCKAGAAISWQNPAKNQEWLEFASTGLDGDISAGIGIDAQFKIVYYQGKFVVHAEAGLTCGPGVSGGINYVVDLKHIAEFVEFVYHKLKDHNFCYLEIITEDAFEFLYRAQHYAIAESLAIENVIQKGKEAVDNWWEKQKFDWESAIKQQSISEKLISQILTNTPKLRHTLPEAKGKMLYIIACNKTIPEERDQAIIKVLSYLQSQNDYRQVMQHITLDGTKIQAQAGGEQWLLNHLLSIDRIQYIDQLKLNKLKTSLNSAALINSVVIVNNAETIFDGEL